MRPEFQDVLSYLQMHADMLRQDYGDILEVETLQTVDQFINSATNLCQKVSQSSLTSLESSRSPSHSASQTETDTDTDTESVPSELPEVVMEFHRLVQQPLPAWLFGDLESRSNALRLAADESSVTESDTESVTNSDYSFGTEPAMFSITINGLIDRLCDLRNSASQTERDLRALASGAQFCCVAYLFMLVFIRQIGQRLCGPEHEADYIRSVKLSANNLNDALDRLNTFITVCVLLLSKSITP